MLDGLIHVASEEAETFCRRKFRKAARVEYYQSYDQDGFDPTPQYLWLDGPIDLGEPFEVVFAMNNKHDAQGEVVTSDVYHIDEDRALVTIQGKWGVNNLALLLPYSYGSFGADPRGFRVTYTGGYTYSEDQDTATNDPLDDWFMVEAPIGLKQVIAQKVKEDWIGDGKAMKVSMPWTPEQKARIRPWIKKDRVGD